MKGEAHLAVDPVGVAGSSRAAVPCSVLDSGLRTVDKFPADGRFHPVKAEILVVVVTVGQGFRRVIDLSRGGYYRVSLRPAAGDAAIAEAPGDEQTRRTLALLEAGELSEARTLITSRLADLEAGRLGDPHATAVIGYVLIQGWELDALAPWCLDFADSNRDMGDALVIAGEWHALQGNHVTALNYFRQLHAPDRRPTYTRGLLRALDRLAEYRWFDIDAPPSRRLEEGRPEAQLLNSWDLDEAEELYEELESRAAGLGLMDAVTAPPPPPPPASYLNRALDGLAGGVQQAARVWIRVIPTRSRSMSPAQEPDVPHPLAEENAPRDPEPRRKLPWRVPVALTAVALTLWAGLLVALIFFAAESTVEWSQLAFALAAVGGIAFAAAGALFATSVQEERVRDAEDRARSVQRDADNGRALAQAVLLDEVAVIEQDEGAVFASVPIEKVPAKDLRRHYADKARRLFPDLQ